MLAACSVLLRTTEKGRGKERTDDSEPLPAVGTKGSVQVRACWRLGTHTPALFHATWELPSPSPRRTHFPSSLELLLAQEQYRPCVIISSQQIPSLHCMPSKLSGVFLVIPDVPYIRTSFSSFKFWASALRCDTNVLT